MGGASGTATDAVGPRLGRRRRRRRAFLVRPRPVRAVLECDDVFFHTNSAVMLPGLPEERMQQDSSGGEEQITGVSILFMVYKYFEANPHKGVIILGHTDTTGGPRDNYELSLLRARGVYALLTGRRDEWAEVCYTRHRVIDYQTLLKHYGYYDARLDDDLGPRTRNALREFRRSHEQYRRQMGMTDAADLEIPEGEDDLEGNKLGVRTWRALFDLYIVELAQLLGCSPSDEGMAAWRERVRFAYPDVPYFGCGESFPIEEPKRDNYRSQANRRVELLFFDPGEAPQFAFPAFQGRPFTREEIPLYQDARFEHVRVDPTDLPTVEIGLQTVDEFGAAVPNASLVLKHNLGKEFRITTDARGYKRVENVPPGTLQVFLEDGSPARFYVSRENVQAVIYTRVAYNSIVSIVVPTHDDEERRERQIRRSVYARPRRPADVTEPSPEAPARRRYLVAVDNLAMAAGWKDGEFNRRRFLERFRTWLADYHPAVQPNRVLLVLLETPSRVLRLMSLDGDEFGRFRLRGGIGAPFGAYGPMEYRDLVLFFDLQGNRVPLHLREQEGVIPLEKLVVSQEEDRFVSTVLAQSSRPLRLVYHVPVGGSLGAVALHGGTGCLEDYPANATINRHVHERNIAVVEASVRAYNAYAEAYRDKVEKTRSPRELKALGPPLSPYRFPRPSGATDQQARELLDVASSADSLSPWVAVVHQLDKFAGRHPDGAVFFRVKFTLGTTTKPVTPPYYTEVKVEYNFDVGSDGLLRKTDRVISTKLDLTAKETGVGREHEVNLETGEQKTTVSLKVKGYGVELSDDGTAKFSGPFGISSQTNVYTAESGAGITIDLAKLGRKILAKIDRDVDPEKEGPIVSQIYFGLHFQGLRQDTVLAVVSGAPGFFERRLLEDLLQRTRWNELTLREQTHLTTLGWTPELWDRRWLLPLSEYPRSCRTRPHQLSAAEKVALVHLGFHYDNWQSAWRAIAARTPAPKRI